MKAKLRRVGYVLGALAFLVAFSYVCFTWGNVQV